MTIRSLISAALCAALLMLSLPPGQASADEAGAFTGKQIFEGVFLGTGRVASALPEIWGDPSFAQWHHDAASPHYQKAISLLESRISKRDPSYFTDLSHDMTSGDPGLISRALDRTHRDIRAAMDPKQAQRLENTVSAARNPDGANLQANYKVKTSAVALTTTAVEVTEVDVVLVVGVIVLVLLVEVFPKLSSNGAGATGYTRERMVAVLAQRLAVTNAR